MSTSKSTSDVGHAPEENNNKAGGDFSEVLAAATEFTPAPEEAPAPLETDPIAFALEDAKYLDDRAVDLDLAWREGLRPAPADVPEGHDRFKLGARWKEHGLCRIYSSQLVVPYQSCLDGKPRIRVRVHHERVVVSQAVEQAGIEVAEEHVATSPRWLATKASAVPYLPSYLWRPWAGRTVPLFEDVEVPLYVVEAPVKALSLATHGYPAISVAGVEAGFLDVSKSLKGKGLLVIHQELGRIEWRGRIVNIIYDAGIHNNPAVARGAARLATVLRGEGADVRIVFLPLLTESAVRAECREVGLPVEAQDSEALGACLDRRTAVESYAGHVKENGDQGPDDYLARWGRYGTALGRTTGAVYGMLESALDRLESVSGDAVLWTEQAVAAAGSKAERIRLARTLFDRLAFQALLALGGEAAIEGVTAAIGCTKSMVQECADKFEARVREQVTSSEPDWKHDLQLNKQGVVQGTLDNVLHILAHEQRWKGVLGYDLFGERTVWRQPPPFDAEIAHGQKFEPEQQVIETDGVRVGAWLAKSEVSPRFLPTIVAFLVATQAQTRLLRSAPCASGPSASII